MSIVHLSQDFIGNIGIGDIISRAWRLYRINAGKVVMFSLVPSIIFAIANVFFSYPSAFAESRSTFYSLFFFCCPFGMVVSAVAVFVSVFFNYGMVKAYFRLYELKTVEYNSLIKEISGKFWDIFKFCMGIFGEVVVFTIIDVLLSLVLYVIIAILMFAFIQTNDFQAVTPSVMMFFTVLIVLCVFIVTIVFALQLFTVLMQIVLYENEKIGVVKSFIRSVHIAFTDYIKAGLFIVGAYMLHWLLSVFFNVQLHLFIYAAVAYLYDILPIKEHAIVPIIIGSLASSVISFLLWPFFISCICLYYVYYRINREGYDLLAYVEKEKSRGFSF